jgi:hypothetical protein
VYFTPIHVFDNKISESDIDGLKIFKLYEHPYIRTQIEVMKTEVMKYQVLADSMKSFEERKGSKKKDTIDLSDWWKSNCGTLPTFTYVLCTIRSRHTLTSVLNYPYSHSLTTEPCSTGQSTTVSR